MADEVMVSPDMLVPLPVGVDPRDACLVEPLGVAVHGFRLAGLRGGMRVAVIGGGSIGQAALAVGRTAGCETAVAARHDAQREAADRLGAAPLTGEPYDIVVDAAGTASALTEAAARCRPGGTMLLLAAYWEGLELPFADVFMKELTVVPSSMYGRSGAVRDMEAAASVLAAVPELPEAVITHRFPLDAAEEGLRHRRQPRRGRHQGRPGDLTALGARRSRRDRDPGQGGGRQKEEPDGRGPEKGQGGEDHGHGDRYGSPGKHNRHGRQEPPVSRGSPRRRVPRVSISDSRPVVQIAGPSSTDSHDAVE